MSEIILHKWQEKALELTMRNDKLLINVVTGAGKTFATIYILKKLLHKFPNLKILISVPKKVILEKTWLPEFFRAGISPLKVGVYYGFAKEIAPITLTTNASVAKTPLDLFDVLIVDEVHNWKTPRLLKILDMFWFKMIGLTSTITDSNGKHIKLLTKFDYNVYSYNIEHAVKDNILSDFNFTLYRLNADRDFYEKYDELSSKMNFIVKKYGSAKRVMNLKNDNADKLKYLSLLFQRKKMVFYYPKRFEEVCKLIKNNPDKKIIVFNEFNDIARELSYNLLDYKVKNRVLNSDFNKDYIDNTLKDYKNGTFNVLLATTMLDEGYNLPQIDMAIIMSGNSSMKQFVQRIGRSIRKVEGKISEIYLLLINKTFEINGLKDKISIYTRVSNKYVDKVIN